MAPGFKAGFKWFQEFLARGAWFPDNFGRAIFRPSLSLKKHVRNQMKADIDTVAGQNQETLKDQTAIRTSPSSTAQTTIKAMRTLHLQRVPLHCCKPGLILSSCFHPPTPNPKLECGVQSRTGHAPTLDWGSGGARQRIRIERFLIVAGHRGVAQCVAMQFANCTIKKYTHRPHDRHIS